MERTSKNTVFSSSSGRVLHIEQLVGHYQVHYLYLHYSRYSPTVQPDVNSKFKEYVEQYQVEALHTKVWNSMKNPEMESKRVARGLQCMCNWMLLNRSIKIDTSIYKY